MRRTAAVACSAAGMLAAAAGTTLVLGLGVGLAVLGALLLVFGLLLGWNS